MDEREQNIINRLILTGALEVAGVDEDTGEFLYNFSPILETVMPDLYDQHMQFVNEEIMYLWENGFLEMDLLSDNPLVVLSDKAFRQDDISKLPKDRQRSLEEIKRILTA